MSTQAEKNPLLRQFAALRRRLRLVILTRGIGLSLCVLLMLGLLGGLLDWQFHLPQLVRALLLIGGLSIAGFMLIRFLLVPMLRRADNLSLALQIEKHYPHLNDSLASTVQFLEQSAAGQRSNDSSRLRLETAKQVMGGVKNYDFKKVIDTRGVMIAAVGGSLAVILVTLAFVLFPSLSGIAFARLTDPFGKHKWPGLTNIHLAEYRQRIGRNEGFELEGTITGVIPADMQMLYQLENDRVDELAWNINDEKEQTTAKFVQVDEKTVNFKLAFARGKFDRNFQFKLQANDGETEWSNIAVLPPPTLVALDGQASPQLRLHFPEYTGLEPLNLSPGKGEVQAVAGTIITLRAAANRPLKQAWLEMIPYPVSTSRLSLTLMPLGAQNALHLLSSHHMSHSILQSIPAKLDDSRRSFFARFQPLISGRTTTLGIMESGRYAIRFVDDANLPGAREYDLRIFRDPEPNVSLERPSSNEDNLNVLPDAILPLEVMVEDPQFGLRSIWLEYRCGNEQVYRRRWLYHPSLNAAELLTAPLRWPGVPVGPMTLIPPKIHFLTRPLHIADFRHANGSALQTGDIVTFRIASDDFDNIAFNKEAGRSVELQLRIISKAKLELDLNRQENNIQKDLIELHQMQQEAIRKVKQVQKKLNLEKQTLDQKDIQQLEESKAIQEKIRERMSSEDPNSLKNRAERMLQTLEQNDMKRSGVKGRMERMLEELDRLSKEELKQVESQLDRANRNANQEKLNTDQSQRAKQLEQAAKETEHQAEQMQKLANDLPMDNPQRAKLQKDAEKLQEQAGQLRKMADDLEQEAKQPPSNPQQQAEERRQLLEKIEQERKRIAQDLQRAAQNDTTGRDRDWQNQAKALEDSNKAIEEQAQNENDLAQSNPQERLQSNLRDARRGQDEVEKTLQSLLEELEPLSDLRQVQGESRELLLKQRELNEEIEKLKKSGLLGKPQEELTRQEKAKLEKLGEEQENLADRTQNLLDKMKELSNERKQSDDADVRRSGQQLDAAREQAQSDNISGQMRETQQQIRQNQLSRASEQQENVEKNLEKLARQLEDRQVDDLDRLIKKMEEEKALLQKLKDEQDRMRKKIKEAEKIKNKDEREKELKRLSREQEKLQQQAQQAAQRLSRANAQRAAQSMRQAAEQMEEAVRRLSRGDPADDQQEEVLDRLNEAQKDLNQKQQKTREQLAREQLAKVADIIKRMQKRQQSLNDEGERLHTKAKESGAWTRVLRPGLTRLAAAEEGLSDEARSVADKQLASAEIFAKVMRRAANAMKRAADALEEHRRKVTQDNGDTSFSGDARRAQQEALRRLRQLVEAINPDDAVAMNQPQQGEGNDQGEQQEEGGRMPGDHIPPLAQLKLLRSMQAEVNERTLEFSEVHPDPEQLTDEEKRELEDIQREQSEIAELIEEYTQPGDEMPDEDEGDDE